MLTNLPQGTTDVRLDPQLNKKVWENGIKGVPYRLRVRISRRRNDEEGAKEKLYSYVQAVNVKNPKIKTWGPTATGIAIVPVLPYLFDKPVEHVTDAAFEWIERKLIERQSESSARTSEL